MAFAVEIIYKNGTQEIIEADENALTKPSNIISDDLRLGEIYDATKENNEWKNAILTSSPKGDKRLSIAKPIAVRDMLNPIKIWQEDNAYIYDFGINTSGVCKPKINAKAGQRITLTFGEILVNGKFSKENTTFSNITDKYFQQDVYICKKGENIWQPTFTYHNQLLAPGEGNTSVCIPVKTLGKHTVTMNTEMVGFPVDKGVRLRAKLYSSVDAYYHNELSVGVTTEKSFTVDANPFVSLSVKQDMHLYAPEDTMSLSVEKSDPDGDTEQVSVRLFRYNRFRKNYKVVPLTDVLEGATESFLPPTDVCDWSVIIASEAPAGTYRLEFQYHDKIEYWDFIVK